MFYAKNLPRWKRVTRVVAGGAMIACGVLGLSEFAIGWLISGVGAFTAITGFIGFCPMCSFAVPRKKLNE
jgi:hypothetical protein